TFVNDKSEPVAWTTDDPPTAPSPPTSKRRRKVAAQDEIKIKIKSRSQVIQYSMILICALEEIVDYDPARHHNRPPPELRIEDKDYLREIQNLIAELRTLRADSGHV